MYNDYMLNYPQYGVMPFNYTTGQVDALSKYADPENDSYAKLAEYMAKGIMSLAPGINGVAGVAEGSAEGADTSAVQGNAYKGAAIDFGLDLAKMGIQYGMQRSLQDYANEYNSPKAMMRRMIEAGINPAAAAQGIAGAPGAGASTTASAPSGGLSRTGLVEALANSTNTALGAGAIRAGIENTNANTEKTKSETTEVNIRNKWADMEHNIWLQKAVADKDISVANAKIIGADAKYADANAFAKWQTTIQNLHQIAAQTKVLEQAYYTEMAKTYATMMQGNLSSAQIHKVFSDIGVNNATIAKIGAEIGNIQADTMLKGQEIKESEARTMAQTIQNKFQNDYYALWKDTGWDMNSNVDMNLYKSLVTGNEDEAKDTMEAMQKYIITQGEGRVKSPDFQWNSDMEVFKSISGMFKLFF